MLQFQGMKSIILFSLILLSQSAIAVNCNDPSPNLVLQGDHYYDLLDVKPLSSKQKSSVSKLFTFLNKQLTGSGVITQCVGPESDSIKVTNNEELSASINFDSDSQLMIFMTSYDPRKKISYNETLSYFGSNNQYTIASYSDSKLNLILKYRKRSGKKFASILYEEIIQFRVIKGTVNLKTTRYINGYFAIEYDRTLK